MQRRPRGISHGNFLLMMLTNVSVYAMVMLTVVIIDSGEEHTMGKTVLSDGEWRIMNLLWERAPLRVPELTELLREETGWSRATVNMMLARQRETARFLDRLYGGSLGLMVSSLAGQKGLSREEIRELYAILEKAEKEGDGDA